MVPWSCLLFFLLQAVMLLAAYQDPNAPWAAPVHQGPYYLWIAAPSSSDQPANELTQSTKRRS